MPRNIAIRLRKNKKPTSKPKPRLDLVRVHTKKELAKIALAGIARRQRNVKKHTNELNAVKTAIAKLEKQTQTAETRKNLRKLKTQRRQVKVDIRVNKEEIEHYKAGRMGSNIKPPTAAERRKLRAEDLEAFYRMHPEERPEK
jgi:septal ring factor EnvC (AmiA/AmiB activator)